MIVLHGRYLCLIVGIQIARNSIKGVASGSPFFMNNQGDDMSDFGITRDEDEVIGWQKTKAFEMNIEKETIYFWKSDYTWDELSKIVDYIKEHRELNAEPEEAPF